MLRRFWFSSPLASALIAMMYLGAHSRWLELALATPVVLWGGWPIFERGWASIMNAQLEHVHPDRAGRRNRVLLQRGGDLGAGNFPAIVPRARRGGRLFRAGRGDRRIGASGTGIGTAGAQPDQRAPSNRCWVLLRKPRGESKRMEPKRMCRSSTVQFATGCACVLARGFPWMA